MNIAPVTARPPSTDAIQYWYIMEALYVRRMARLRTFVIIVLLSCIALFLLSMLQPTVGNVDVSTFLPAVAGIQ